jgi:acetylglutamate kinase
MAAKLQAAAAALARGVERVRIGDFQAILDPEAGTTLVPSRSFA